MNSNQEIFQLQIMQIPGTEDLPIPGKMSTGAAGFDLYAAVKEAVELLPGKRVLIPTGICLALPTTLEAQVRPRSGLALKQGVTCLNSPGTIDADYRGEVGVILINHGDEPLWIRRGDRIAQLVVQFVPAIQWQIVNQLPDSSRGSGGFGHTGM
jgi:dUTP pyrophosphatase